MALGEVKWFNDEKGFGFIVAPGGGPDIFFHRSVLNPRVVIEDRCQVEYESEKSDRGMCATKVTRIGPPVAAV